MDGLELPAGLVAWFDRLGLQWPQAKEFALMRRGMACLEFSRGAMFHAERSRSAVGVMLSTNHSAGLDAFAVHMEKVAGRSGYLFRAMVADALCGLGMIQAAQLVFMFKVSTIIAVASFAVVSMAAALAAPETGGASLGVAAEYGAEVYAGIIVGQRATEELLREVGLPVSAEIARLLDVQVKRLQARPIHRGSDGVHSVPTEAEQSARYAEYARRHKEMGHDPAHKRTTPTAEREATVALGLEAAGKMHHVDRDAHDRKADFYDVASDGTRTRWDVKTIPSVGVRAKAKRKHCYSDTLATTLIEGKLKDGIKVVMDTRDLTPDRKSVV